MKTRRTIRVGRMNREVVVLHEPTKVVLPWIARLENGQHTHAGLQGAVERYDVVLGHGFFIHMRRPSFASWWQIPCLSATFVTPASALPVTSTCAAVEIAARTRTSASG